MTSGILINIVLNSGISIVSRTRGPMELFNLVLYLILRRLEKRSYLFNCKGNICATFCGYTGFTPSDYLYLCLRKAEGLYVGVFVTSSVAILLTCDFLMLKFIRLLVITFAMNFHQDAAI